MTDATTPDAYPFPARTTHLRASWARSRDHGLDRAAALPGDALATTELADRLDANRKLLTFSRPVIENLFRQIDSPASTVLLTDGQGVILSAVGDPDFLDRAARIALRPGVQWDEESMGTNAIGTAIVTGDIVAIEGSEHYLRRNRFLTCVATPIFAPDGEIAGILDISTDARGGLSHADALLRTTAEFIEHRLIENLDDGFLTLRFHHRADLLGSPLEAVAVFDEAGSLLALNRAARILLGLTEARPRVSCDECFTTSWGHLANWAALAQPAPFPVRTSRGRVCIAHARLRGSDAPARSMRPAPGPAATAIEARVDLSSSPLAAMASGDLGMNRALAAIARWHLGAGPLLIEGETGTGKRHLVHAYHRTHAAAAPLLCVDGAALANSPDVAAELARALEQAGSGLLYLTDIDALPAAQQARLFANTDRRPRLIVSTRNPAALQAGGRIALAPFHAAGGHLIHLPPLRERTDFDALVRAFVRQAAPSRPPYVCPDALTLLHRHRWPGNLSELHNRLRLILALMGDDAEQLCPEDIPEELLEPIDD